MTNPDLFKDKGNTPVVTNSSTNNGVTGWVNLKPTEKGGIITYSDTTTSEGIFYQPLDFIGYSHIQGLYPYNPEKWDEDSLLYFTSVFKKSAAGRFDYANKFNRTIASQLKVTLPSINNEIDFAFMRSYIATLKAERLATLKAERLATLKAYLKAAGLSDTILSEGELAALDALRQNRVDWKPFAIGDIFDEPQSGDVDIQNRDINGKGCLFINSGVTNCGIKGRTDIDARTFPANSITIDFFGNAYYRSEDYKLATHNHVFSFTGNIIKDQSIGLFLIAALSYLTQIYSYGNMATKPTLKKNDVNLPTNTEGQIDFEFMGKLISAQIKLSINDLLTAKDLEITTTEQIINHS